MEKGTYTVTKSTAECFKLRHSSGMYWADITIDAKDHTGRIQIASDFGSWQYFWGACGKPFIEFLSGLDIQYTAGKFGADQFFDSEQTLKDYENAVNEADLPGKTISTLYAEILSLKNISHKGEFCSGIGECHNLLVFFDGCPNLCYSIDPGFKKFWEMVWPEFLAAAKGDHPITNPTVETKEI